MDIYSLSKEINKNAHQKGFWEENYNTAEKLALIHSEVSEALECDRKGRYADPCDKILQPCYVIIDEEAFAKDFEAKVKDTFEDELADIVIRVFDLAFEKGIDLENHIELKMMYNKTRPYKHGKKY